MALAIKTLSENRECVVGLFGERMAQRSHTSRVSQLGRPDNANRAVVGGQTVVLPAITIAHGRLEIV